MHQLKIDMTHLINTVAFRQTSDIGVKVSVHLNRNRLCCLAMSEGKNCERLLHVQTVCCQLWDETWWFCVRVHFQMAFMELHLVVRTKSWKKLRNARPCYRSLQVLNSARHSRPFTCTFIHKRQRLPCMDLKQPVIFRCSAIYSKLARSHH